MIACGWVAYSTQDRARMRVKAGAGWERRMGLLAALNMGPSICPTQGIEPLALRLSKLTPRESLTPPP
eukprot:CAMPEP_0174719440 /NCGR_PEP_ID=MMETSP1094-20130205/31121_1 /TAXON_ID=156173 /ORGANISM="Chrysochromulina brevifilum, Strain UTEX LB 985" /LENGTH=67 /DNA_ID=CAMNT_0015919733 /DNA_START=455 /DNA_END=656 /DNA_ORIENTATION=-